MTMPEIVIKQILKDDQFKRGLSENAGNIRNWGKEAERVFNAVQTPLDQYSLKLARLEKIRGMIGEEIYHRALAHMPPPLPAMPPPLPTAKIPGGIEEPFGAAVLGMGTHRSFQFLGHEVQMAGMVLGQFNQGLGATVSGVGLTITSVGMAVHSFTALSRVLTVTAVAQTAFNLTNPIGWTILAAGAIAAAGVALGAYCYELKGAEADVHNLLEELKKLNEEGDKAAARKRAASVKETSEGKPPKVPEKSPWEMSSAELKTKVDESEKVLKAAETRAEHMRDALAINEKLISQEKERGGVQARSAHGFLGGAKPAIETSEALQNLLVQENFIKGALAGERQARTQHGVFVAALEQAQTKDLQTEIKTRIAEIHKERMAREQDRFAAMREELIRKGAKPEALRGFDVEVATARKTQEVDVQQKQGEAMAKSWHDRLAAARDDADELAAVLIAGSKEFAGNLDKARGFIQKVKAAEAEKAMGKEAERVEEALGKDAEHFEKAMQREYNARQGESSREAQLREFVDRGLDPKQARLLAWDVALLDAQDAAAKMGGRLAGNIAAGSREAFNLVASAQQAGKVGSPEAIAARTEAYYREMIKELRIANNKPGPRVAPIPA